MSWGVTDRRSIAAIRRLTAWTLPLVVAVHAVSVPAEFLRAATGTEVAAIDLPTATGPVRVPGHSGWQLIVTVSPDGRKSEAVSVDLGRLASRVPAEGWSPLLVVSQASPGDSLPFELPAGIPVAYDPHRAWYAHLGMFVLPAAALFDPQGVLRWQRSGHSRDWLDVTEDTLRHFLGLPPVPRGIAPGPTGNRDAERHYRMGMALAKEGRLGEALSALDSALLLDGAFGKAYLERGDVHRQRADVERAGQDYRKALEADSTLYRAWVGIGHLALDARRLDEAVQAADRALSFNERSGDALLVKSRALVGLGRFPEAEEILERLLLMSPGKADTRYYLGLVYESTGRQQEALASYREALRLLLKDSPD